MPPTRRIKRLVMSFVFGAGDTVKEYASIIEGTVQQIHLRVPNNDNNVGATLTVEDEDGYEIYNSGSKAENANYNIPGGLRATGSSPLLITGNSTFKVTLAGAPGNAITVVAVILYDGI